jgi:hypothetical protein
MKTKGTEIIDIQKFKPANDMFKACLVKVKREGKGETKHKEIISEEDRKKYSTQAFCQQTILPVSNTKFSLNFDCSFAIEVGRMY